MKDMADQFMFLPVALMNRQTIIELQKCNDYTVRYGLQLTAQDIYELVESRREALEKNGRIEFGGGVIQKIIMEFADSPYLNQEDYQETLAELQDIFYYFKNEALEELTDDELIRVMKKYYDDTCQGSLDYLKSTILENYCRDIRYGTNEYSSFSGYDEDYTQFLDWDE
jgi:hypothetical protein